jgi:hypothetical protein
MDMDSTSETITKLQSKLAQAEAEVGKIKKAINLLCELDDKPAMYPETENISQVVVRLKGDEYHNMPQATAITEILERRKSANLAPVTVDEIYDDLIAGGFQFTKGKNEGIQKRGIAISMSKNRKFYRLPNEKWGIKTWYNIKDAKEDSNNEPVQNTQENKEDPENNADNEE